MAKRLPTEFAINMYLDKILILQQSELESEIEAINYYFDKYNPCHLYFICRRPRISINIEKSEVTNDYIKLAINIQKRNIMEEREYFLQNNFNKDNIKIKSEYPYNRVQIISGDEVLIDVKLAPFLQRGLIPEADTDFLDLEVLYIGQSYGVEGARTAPDRLKSHSTLQGIYFEAITNNPDSEIWLALASFSQINVTMMDGTSQYSDEELADDNIRFPKVFNKLQFDGINEQQKINFTEAALIKYFQPKYNVIYKDSFPNPAHKTYLECYELDINSICIELQTYEKLNCNMYSDKVGKAPYHLKYFLLNSIEDRKNMFELI